MRLAVALLALLPVLPASDCDRDSRVLRRRRQPAAQHARRRGGGSPHRRGL